MIIPLDNSQVDHIDYDAFVEANWRYDPTRHGNMPELGYVALALCGEAGEAAEKVKKAYRETDGIPDQTALAKELGDVLYYLVKEAHLLGFTLEDIARMNIVKLKDRVARGKSHGEGDER